jgi:hypothetical protein
MYRKTLHRQLMRRCLAVLALLLGAPLVLAMTAASEIVSVQVVDERGMPVRDAVVEFDPRGGYDGRIRFPWKPAMAQRNEEFVPGTLIIAKGSTVAFPNLDRVRHSVYSFSKPARFEIDLYGRETTRTHTFPIAGGVTLGCNIHDQMRGYIRVVDTPYAAKTDRNGIAKLDGLPAGVGRLTVWHPRLRARGNEFAKAFSGSSRRDRIVVRMR